MSSTTVALLCGTITALMAAYGIGRHMRLTHLPLIVKCAIPAVFAVLGFLHFVLLHVDAGFSRAFVIDTMPITALFVSLIFWFFILTVLADAILGFLHFVLLHVDAGFSRAFVIDTMPITALFVSLIFWFFILTVLADAILLVRWGIAKACGLTLAKRSVFTIILSSAVGVVAFVFGLTSAWSALSDPEKETITVEVKDLPAELTTLKVVQLSDLHVSNLFPATHTESVVAAVNALKPDLVLITGDFADGAIDTPEGYANRDKDLAPLEDLKATYGVYGVSGNHEYIGGAYQPLSAILKNHGVTLLENAHERLTVNGRAVTIVGVTDLAAYRAGEAAHNLEAALANVQNDDLLENAHERLTVNGRAVTIVGVTDLAAYRAGEAAHNLEAALANVQNDDLRILMDHQPRAAAESANPKFGIDLQLSGHTHGGHTGLVGMLAARANAGFLKGLYQVGDAAESANPKFGIDLQLSGHTHGGHTGLVGMLAARANAGFLKGLYQVGDMTLYVSQGTGFWAGFPVRSGTWNEITEIHFKAK